MNAGGVVTEEALIARCAAGEAAAARELVRRYQADVVRFVSRMLGAGDPAVDDLVQLTFVAALQAAPSFAGRSRVRTWLLGIAHNKVRMEIRSRTRRRRILSLFGAVRRVAPPTGPLRPDHDLSDLQAALDALDPDTELSICRNIKALGSNITVLAVTHREAWVDIADRTYRLDRSGAHPVDGSDLRRRA